MRSFYTKFQAILIAVFLISPLIAGFFSDVIDNKLAKYSILILCAIWGFYLIDKYVKKVFYQPIVDLEMIIKRFITWEFKNENIKFEKNNNPSLNFILIFFNQVINSLKNIKDEFIQGKEIKSEVDLWKEIQWKMLNKKLLTIPSLDILIKSKPAWEIGWDSYDIIKQKDSYYIYVWDATGHWVGAWFIMIMVNALISWFAKVFKSGAIILSKTNEILKPRIKANLLMTLLLVRWDEEEKKIFMTWAGHEYLMIYKQNQRKAYKIKSGWVALWMIKDISTLIKEKEIKFEKNDIIVLYSDWVTEAINKSSKDWFEEMFWEQRLIDSIENAPNWVWKNYKTANSVFNNITIELSRFMWYKHTQLDDVTLAVIHYKWTEIKNESDFNNEIKQDYITEWNWL